jgi:rhamnulokinase
LKSLAELEVITGRKFERLYLMGGEQNSLLNNFISNALQLPVVLVSADAAPIGNVLVQALTLGHVPSLEAGREIVRRSFRTQAIIPHPATWDNAAERLLNLIGYLGDPVPA